eukprot:6215894-Pyramimonas_sp.AAC.1
MDTMAGAFGGNAYLGADLAEYRVFPAIAARDVSHRAPQTPRSIHDHIENAADNNARRAPRAGVHPQILTI